MVRNKREAYDDDDDDDDDVNMATHLFRTKYRIHAMWPRGGAYKESSSSSFGELWESGQFRVVETLANFKENHIFKIVFLFKFEEFRTTLTTFVKWLFVLLLCGVLKKLWVLYPKVIPIKVKGPSPFQAKSISRTLISCPSPSHSSSVSPSVHRSV